jgi:hypothetical protein
MKGLRVTGAIGALYVGAVFVLSLVLYLVTLPGLGLTVADLSDPAKILPIYNGSVGLHLISWLNVMFGIGLALVVTELYVRFRNTESGFFPVAAIFGAISAGLLVFSGGMMVYAVPTFANAIGSASTSAAYTAIYTIGNGVGNAGFMTMGIWAILTGLGAAQVKCISPAVSYFGVLFGLSALMPMFLGTVVSVSIIYGISSSIGIIWFIWLGIELAYVPAGQMAMETCTSSARGNMSM